MRTARELRGLRTARSFLLTCLIPCASLLWGIFFLTPGEELGFTLLNYYAALPLNALLSGLLMARGFRGALWLQPVLCGVFAVLLPYTVFGAVQPLWGMMGVCPALLGLSVGTLLRSHTGAVCTART